MRFEAFLSPADIAALQQEEAQSDKVQKRTPEQIEAIYTNGQNVLVSASAGSGKTFVMVERILDKIKRGIGVDQLFISTFTVKAAGELKERIERQLTKAIRDSQDEELKRHLSAQLTHLPNAAIGTMDAFTQQLVVTYGYLLGIAPTFRILQDKNEQDLLKQEVFSDLVSDYMAGKDQVVFQQLVRNFSSHRKDLKGFREVVYQIHTFSQSTSHPKDWLQERFLKGYERFTTLDSLPASTFEGLLDSMERAANDLQDLTDLPDYKKQTKAGKPTAQYTKHIAIISQLRELLAEQDRDSKMECLYSTEIKNRPENTVEDRTGVHQDKLTKYPFDVQRVLPEVVAQLVAILPSGSEVTVAGEKYPVFKDLQERLTNLKHLETVLAYQPKILPLLGLLRDFVLDFSDQYLQRKMQENSYEFTDISHFAIQILATYPEIRRLYQSTYHEVMVDEYQDNNHIQERMLDLLSNGHNRFMVGDIKQSIYRFRQADPRIFQEKFERYQADPSAGKLILLKENFRSQCEVLDATNAIFTRLMDKAVGQINYDETHCLVAGSDRQKIRQPHHQMEYLIYNTDVDADKEEDLEQDEFSAGEVELVAKEIIRLHTEEQVAFSDITLLVSSRTRNERILTSFEQHGIPLVSDGGEAHYLKSLEVMVMLDTLRAIHNPLNDYPLIALLKSPMFRLTEDELTRIALQADSAYFYQKFQRALNASGVHPQLISPALKKKLAHIEAHLVNWRLYAKTHSIYDLIWKIFNEKLYYDYVGALPNGEKRQANLYALGLRANQFEKTGFKGLARFITMIDKLIASDNDLADVEVALPQNAVQLMTIHKSKGLEFKYVFLLNMDKDFSRQESRSPIVLSRENGIGAQYLADMKDKFDTPLPQVRVQMNTLPYQLNQEELKRLSLSEQMRLLYVAMTRAEQKLYLVGKGSREKLSNKYDGKSRLGVLAQSTRESMTNFQDWILAIEQAFQGQDLHFKKTFVEAEDLTPEKIGKLAVLSHLPTDDQRENRQSEDIVAALDQLAAVEKLNQDYRAAIDLPSVRTPSQIKKLYEPVLADDGLEIMETYVPNRKFILPDFSSKQKVTGAQIGSAVHELMQRLPLVPPITADLVTDTLLQVNAEEAVKEQIDVSKIVAFFETPLGQEILAHRNLVRREQPFAVLQRDVEAEEDYVLRGIIDGFIHYPDRIVLFDYKTDHYQQSSQLAERYRGQMQLYADALQQAYQVSVVEKYLILLGGDTIEVVHLP
ncbi:helicase-exonuclease AddAB subunit AddA [Streptococcus acidominimus]|uniref:ATP-dependent helicase/nuclease subunit A n=1 Tax=Streptococcus acidominimus TaxID=1326 RepID=A0A4Y9FP70_STRAI|nr:helicase-exonuclease AddAB subunit AddA [Streptococcus acidominimus]MBF0818625.1 helicase-exonuclease AddAB subunit AddA [Streptococcus acidominimus]MBF0838935.1 helicase-exonuclease AddAB subunit AddA [Streptococcus acidominimus]MBF0847118.1 helicase-exonuclease AddAB subunit AddA [Streptococcus danieliae]TFU31007.1 helicase-exonuclease AddAB subunit AddA [Streptococcus acidominimus]